jgi:ketosteroid isomerase-like protein
VRADARDELTSSRAQVRLAREAYGAYVSGDRDVIDRHVSEDYTFFSPADVGIDRAAYLERCWPNAKRIDGYDFVRGVESGDEVIITHEARRTDGTRFRNTEVLTFRGEKICRTEVYFGLNLD